MLIDDCLPQFDTTIIEHLVIEAPCDVVHRTTRNMDFLQIHSPIVDTLMFVRGLPGLLRRRIGRRPPPTPPPAMRLADMLDGEANADGLEGWLALGEVPERELAFGAIGRFWQPDITWKSVTAEEFPGFSEPDFAKIAAEFSARPYGRNRTLLTYEARTAGTDKSASRKFLRYWWLVRPFVRIVMRAALLTAKDLAESDHDSMGKRNLEHTERGDQATDDNSD